MKRTVELTADRRLLDAEFEGYRLGGRPASARRVPLPRAPARSEPRPSHRSLLHARLHALHNALSPDPFAADPSAYFVDGEGGVWRARRRADLKLERALRPGAPPVVAGPHPPVLSLFSPTRAALSLSPRLLLVDTGDREGDGEWTVEADVAPLGPDAAFSLLDARAEGAEVHCLLHRIEPVGDRCANEIDWVVLSRDGDECRVRPHRKIRGPGAVHYCALEPGCAAVYLAADGPPEFVRDAADVGAPPDAPEAPRRKTYRWLQTVEDIALTVPLGPDASKDRLVVDVDGDSIRIARDGVDLFGGRLHAAVEGELTTWTLDRAGGLDVLLPKREPSLWPSFLKDGDPDGERATDPELVREVHARLSHLCSETGAVPDDAPAFDSRQLEECDLVSEEDSCLVRLEASSCDTSHRAFLSAHRPVLNVRLGPSEAPALGLRHDADACLWQPRKPEGGEWPVRHEGTLLAFGYVQSSKQQRKYTVCSPNLEYSVVCEPNRHAFVYRQEWTPRRNSQLRRRTPSGENRRVKVGKQQLISFDRDEEVLGICATDDILFVLTEKNIIAFEMSE